MASLKDAVKAFLKSRVLYSDWCEYHEAVVTNMETIANMMARLPALAAPSSYVRFAGDDDQLCTEVYTAQLKQLEETWQTALESMASAHKCVPLLQRRHAELLARVKSSEVLLTLTAFKSPLEDALQVRKEVLERKAGPDPSVAELLETMNCMHLMIARQSHVEQQIMDNLTYDTSEEDMGHILKFFHDTPEVDKDKIDMMIAQVEATQMK